MSNAYRYPEQSSSVQQGYDESGYSSGRGYNRGNTGYNDSDDDYPQRRGNQGYGDYDDQGFSDSGRQGEFGGYSGQGLGRQGGYGQDYGNQGSGGFGGQGGYGKDYGDEGMRGYGSPGLGGYGGQQESHGSGYGAREPSRPKGMMEKLGGMVKKNIGGIFSKDARNEGERQKNVGQQMMDEGKRLAAYKKHGRTIQREPMMSGGSGMGETGSGGVGY
ncbi:hypothetical protein HK098_002649 [Nowakowskiella sp. JEL0407]|nr:hypothetical protein HK098_002649 [Nowakowskiella sp. JEL0407]